MNPISGSIYSDHNITYNYDVIYVDKEYRHLKNAEQFQEDKK
jgi:hypothetical protein